MTCHAEALLAEASTHESLGYTCTCVLVQV
jgi:hypothetical protein